MEDENRLVDVETRVAHQEQAILELSEELYRQQQQLAQLEARWRGLVERVDSLAGGSAPGDAADEVPPHY
ncbi:MAG: SlyX family protein [Gammaproteobacteria bacterium]